MTKTKAIIAGILLLSLFAFGLIALAGNGFGRGGYADRTGTAQYLQERDSDGDGTLNCDDPDWSPPLDGSGYGAMSWSGSGPHDGTGSGFAGNDGMSHGYRQGQNINAPCDGSCLE